MSIHHNDMLATFYCRLKIVKIHIFVLQAADQKAALQVFDEMVSQGMKPTPQCYTSLLAACSRAGDLTAARRVFRTMHVDRNVAAYTALMDACLKKGTPAALDEAFEASVLY